MILSDLPKSFGQLASPQALAHSSIGCVSYRDSWKDTQPNPPAGGPTNNPNDPSFNWVFWDAAIAQATQAGILASFHVSTNGTANQPPWIKPLTQQFIDIAGDSMAVPWDSTYQAYVNAFIQAVGARYGGYKNLFKWSTCIASTGSDWVMPHQTNGNWQNSAAFTCPAFGQTVTVPTTVNSGMNTNQLCYIPGFGWFQCTNVPGPGPTQTHLLNTGASGNASSGTVAANTTIQVSDVANWQSPIYGYTTTKLVNACMATISTARGAFPTAWIQFQVGTSGSLDPFPGAGNYAYNAATQIAQQAYAGITNFAVDRDGFNPQINTPAAALAAQDSSGWYLLAQTLAGSTNTSGTTGSIPAGGAVFGQFDWPAFDPTGQYTSASTNGYLANGGVPYTNPLPVFNQTIAMAQQYGVDFLELYDWDVVALLGIKPAAPLLSCLPASLTLCDPRALTNYQVAMGSYRQGHDTLQPNAPAGGITSNPNDPSWNWSFFDSAVAQAAQYGKGAFLRVFFQAHSPAWVSANAQQFVPINNPTLNIWWDPYFQSAVTAVIQAMGARYGNNPIVKAVSFNIVAESSGDWSFPHSTNANWQNTSSFTVPAVGSTVNVQTGGHSSGMSQGQYCYVPGAGWFYANVGAGGQHTTLFNPGTAGNAAPGTVVPANTTIQVSDILTLQTIYGYTTAKLVGAVTALLPVIQAAFPNALNDQEVGRNGTMDPYPSVGPIGPVQQSIGNAAGSNPYTGSFSKPVTAGNTLVVAFSWNAASGSVTSFTDTLNNAQWTPLSIVQGNARSLVLYKYTNTLGGNCTVQVTLSAAQGTERMAFFELPGSAVVAETPATAVGALTTTVTTPTITPANSNDWVLALLLGGNPVSAGSSGWSGFQTQNTLASQYLAPGSTAPLSAQFTQANSTYVTIILAFSGVAQPPGPTYQYNAATQIAQWGFEYELNFAVGKNTVQAGNKVPRASLAQQDNDDLYLPAQTLAGSANTSGTTGIILPGSPLIMQALWVCYDATGAYSPASTQPSNGNFGPYCQNGGVPYNAQTVSQVLAATLNLMGLYGAIIAEIYQNDLVFVLPFLQPWIWVGETGPQLFPPYAGQNQTALILVSAPAPPMEDGPRCSCYLPPDPAPTYDPAFSLWNRMEIFGGTQMSDQVHNWGQ